MTVVVVDASALLEYLLGTHAAGPVRDVLRAEGTELHVPGLCDVEVSAGLRRGLIHRLIPVQSAEDAVADYLDMRLTRHGHQALIPRIVELRDNFTAYDAAYVALAELLGGSLLTADTRLARAARAQTDLAVLT